MAALPKEEVARRELILRKYGFKVGDRKTWWQKYKTFRNNKLAQGYAVEINATTYLRLASKAGIKRPNQIGLRMDQFQMGRIGDKGDYIKGNCRFITAQQNADERFTNGGAARGYKKSSKTLTGRTKENYAPKRSAAKKLSKPFKLVSPKGKVHIGINLLEFCQRKRLSLAIMSRLCRGGCLVTKEGWIGTYTGNRGEPCLKQ